MSNKSSFWEHKAAGTLRVRLTLGPAASESRVSCVALKPQVGDRKLAGGQEQRPRTPYLNKGELAARNVITGAQQAPGGEGVGGRCVGGFVLRFFFSFCGCCFLFYLFSFGVFNSPGAWQSLAAIPTRPFPVQTAPVNFYNPALKLQARLPLPAPVIYLAGLSGLTFFHVCVTPAVATTSLRLLKCQQPPSPGESWEVFQPFMVSGSSSASCHFPLRSAFL